MKKDLQTTDIPDNLFIDTIKLKEIFKIKMVSYQDRKKLGMVPGYPDVRISGVDGKAHFIDRKTLIDNFLHVSGRKIKLYLLRNNKVYTIYQPCNKVCKAFIVPNNHTVSIKAKVVTPGNYIICNLDESGSIDKESAYSVSNKMFRKMFRIPMQDLLNPEIRNNTNTQRNTMQSKLNNITKPIQKTMTKPIKEIIEKPVEKPMEQPIGQHTENKTSTIRNNNTVRLDKDSNIKDRVVKEYKFTAIARIVDPSNRKQVGFLIQSLENKKQVPMSMIQVLKLCEQKKVDNLISVYKQSNQTKFIKGNGIRIESLPEVLS